MSWRQRGGNLKKTGKKKKEEIITSDRRNEREEKNRKRKTFPLVAKKRRKKRQISISSIKKEETAHAGLRGRPLCRKPKHERKKPEEPYKTKEELDKKADWGGAHKHRSVGVTL